MATFLVRTGVRQRALGEGVRLLHAASQHLRLPQGETTERLKPSCCPGSRLFHPLRQQRHSGGNAPAQDVRLPQSRGYGGKPEHDVRVLTDAYRPFQQRECPGQVALAEGEQTAPPRGHA